MKNIKFSFIIPHKNSPKLLERCLASIPRNENIQIIVVDDNSSTNIVDFDHFPGKDEKCVEVYLTKAGKGAGYARNIGLKYALGDWIIFADADDYFTDNALSILNKQYKNNADVVYFYSQSIYDDTKEKADRANIYNSLVNAYLSDRTMENKIRVGFLVPWAKMIKRYLIEKNNIQFDEVPAANDVYFAVLTGLAARCIDAVPETIYVVTVNRGSITRRRNYEIAYSQYYVNLKRNFYLKKIGLGIEQYSILYKYLECLKYKPYNFFHLTGLLFKFRQNIFVGYKNWINTFFMLRKKHKREEHYFTK